MKKIKNMIKLFPLFARYLQRMVSLIGRKSIFRQTDADNLLTRSLVLAEKLLPRNLVPLIVDFTTGQNRIFSPQK